MSSKEIKDLLIINLTAAIALATSSLLPKSVLYTSQIDYTNVCYWLYIGLLLFCLANVNRVESACNQNMEHNCCIILKINLYLAAVLMITVALGYILSFPLQILQILPLIFLFLELGLMGIYTVYILLLSGSNFRIISLLHYIKGKISNLIMLLGIAIFFSIPVF